MMASSKATRSTGTFHTTRLMAICYGLGFLGLGLGQGMGWGYRWTPYPAISGIAIQIAGAVLLLISILLSMRHRPPPAARTDS